MERRCCVCGVTLPDLPVSTLIAKGAGTQQPDGSWHWHCIGGRHTKEEIERAEFLAMGFRKGSEVRK